MPQISETCWVDYGPQLAQIKADILGWRKFLHNEMLTVCVDNDQHFQYRVRFYWPEQERCDKHLQLHSRDYIKPIFNSKSHKLRLPLSGKFPCGWGSMQRLPWSCRPSISWGFINITWGFILQNLSGALGYLNIKLPIDLPLVNQLISWHERWIWGSPGTSWPGDRLAHQRPKQDSSVFTRKSLYSNPSVAYANCCYKLSEHVVLESAMMPHSSPHFAQIAVSVQTSWWVAGLALNNQSCVRCTTQAKQQTNLQKIKIMNSLKMQRNWSQEATWKQQKCMTKQNKRIDSTRCALSCIILTNLAVHGL